MKTPATLFPFSDDDLEATVSDGIAVIHIRRNAFEVVTDLSESAHLFELLDNARSDPRIVAVLLGNAPGAFSGAAYRDFLERADATSRGEDKRDNLRKRQINILNHFIQTAIAYPKLIVAVLQGEVVTPFMGAALACDMCLAGPDLTFSLAHVTHGRHPSGALPYFLPKYIGVPRARHLLFNGGTIPAREALEMGLLADVIAEADLLSAATDAVRKLAGERRDMIRRTKRLMGIFWEDIQKYFEVENGLMIR